MNSANRPERTPNARRQPDAGQPKASSSAPGIRPSASVSRCSGPRSAALSRAMASAANNGARSARICRPARPAAATRTRSRAAPSRNSLSSTCTRGRSGSRPAHQSGDRRRLPGQPVISGQRKRIIGGGRQHRHPARHFRTQGAPGGAQHQFLLVADRERVGDEAEALDVADIVALDHHLAANGDGGQQFLARRPLPAAASGGPTRRSTKRVVRLSCSASDSLSSTSRARFCQCTVSFTQSGRAAIYDQTRTPDSRCISVSISPSARSSPAICAASQSVGRWVSVATWPNTRAHSLAWVSSASLRKSGIWQASHSSRMPPPPAAPACGSPGRATAPSRSPGRTPRCRAPAPAPAAAR